MRKQQIKQYEKKYRNRLKDKEKKLLYKQNLQEKHRWNTQRMLVTIVCHKELSSFFSSLQLDEVQWTMIVRRIQIDKKKNRWNTLLFRLLQQCRCYIATEVVI